MTTMQELTDRAIERAASGVAWWVRNAGETFASAAARIKETSTLGPKSWDRALARASEILAATN